MKFLKLGFMMAIFAGSVQAESFLMAEKCCPAPYDFVSRTIGVTSGLWAQAERNCTELIEVAKYEPRFGDASAQSYPGVSYTTSLQKIDNPNRWLAIGCPNGGHNQGYFLQVRVEMNRPQYDWAYAPRAYQQYDNNRYGRENCENDANAYRWFSSPSVTLTAQCVEARDNKLMRYVSMAFHR